MKWSFSLLAASSNPHNPSITSPTTFWHDIDRVRRELPSTFLVPPPFLLTQLQQAPFRGALEPISVETGIPLHECDIIQGSLPPNLVGRLCRNGPGRIRLPLGEASDTLRQYGHWFDGDGFVTQLVLHANGTATFSGQYVRTERLQAQQQKKSADYDGFAKPGAWTKRAQGKWWQNLFAIATNPANTNVIFTKQCTNTTLLYAIAEGGHPIQLDLDTLQTITDAKPWTTPDGNNQCQSFFSAHYSRDFQTTLIYNHGVVVGPSGTAVNVMKCTADGKLVDQKMHPLPFLTFIHDNVISENHLLLVLQPFGAPPTALRDLILGRQSLGKQFQWDTEAYGKDSIVMVFSKETLECVAQVPIGPVSTYHLIDAFEQKANKKNGESTKGASTATCCSTLTLRVACHPDSAQRNHLEDCFQDLYTARQVPACELHEFVLDLETQSLQRRQQLVPDALPFELPDMNGGFPSYRKRYIYLNSRLPDDDFINSIQKVDLETGKVGQRLEWGKGVVAGGPIFVPKPAGTAEDDGYVFVPLYRSLDHKSDIVILDAQTMQTVTRLRLQSHVPYQFHGAWQGAAAT